RLVLDQNDAGHLINAARLRLLVELQVSDGQTHRIRIVTGAEREPLLPEFRRPGGIWKAAFDVAAGFEKGRHRRTLRIVGKPGRCRFKRDAAPSGAADGRTTTSSRTRAACGGLRISRWCSCSIRSGGSIRAPATTASLSAARTARAWRSTVGAHPHAR